MEFGYKEESKSPFAAIIREWPVLLIEVIVAIVLGYLVTSYGLERIQVSGNSMNLILQDGDTILVNKMTYKIFSPSRNDVIVFRQEGQEHNYYSVKRVVALPGETVQIMDGILYINDKPYEEINKVEKMITAGVAEEKITLEKGEYFVLGDNRNQSEDSRYSSVGMITKKEIIGKAWIRLKPTFDFISWLKYEGEEEKKEV
ncbi:MAG: signal peptidase I [Lachnospiraceae bacterium]|nr:signal peptidase I [Lachnospiraceae bacterium]